MAAIIHLFTFLIPSYISTLAWVQFFGGNGPIQFLFHQSVNLYSMGGIIFVLGLSHYPLVYLMSVEVFRRIPRELKYAANTSGASGGVVFRKVIFPMALPGIASGGILAFYLILIILAFRLFLVYQQISAF